MLRTTSTLFVLAACQRDDRRQLRRPPNWYQNLGPAARSEYASEVPSAAYCEEQAARRVAWETARAHAAWLPTNRTTGCAPRAAECLEDSLAGCCDVAEAAPAARRADRWAANRTAYVAVSLVSSDPACGVRDAVSNILRSSDALVVVHVGCYSAATPAERAALSGDRVLVDPSCVPVLRAYGSLLHAHLRNVGLLGTCARRRSTPHVAPRIGTLARPPSHVVLAAANLYWVAPGLEAASRGRDDFREIWGGKTIVTVVRGRLEAYVVARGSSAYGAGLADLPAARAGGGADDDGDWAAIRGLLADPLFGDGRRALQQKHEGSFYPFPFLEAARAFLAARGPLGRLNHRTCLCDATKLCLEEWYLPNLFLGLANESLAAFGNARCRPDCADCHDCHGSTFFGTVAERDRLAAADRGVRKFAIKHYLHRDCSGKRPPGYEPG